MNTILLNRRLLLKLLALIPALRKFLEPAPEVVQPIAPEPPFLRVHRDRCKQLERQLSMRIFTTTRMHELNEMHKREA